MAVNSGAPHGVPVPTSSEDVGTWSGQRLAAKVRLLALCTHPGPTAAVTVLAVVLATGAGLSPARTVLLGLAILTGQLSIGLANDWLDAGRDAAVGRADKPAARGRVPVPVVRRAALCCAGLTVVLSLLLGARPGAAHLVLVASGWAYDLGLKRTAASVLPFVVSFGLLPAFVCLSLPGAPFAAPWAVVTGALFGVSVHFTNVLPDLEDDARTAVRGLPHRLGRTASGLVAFAVLVVAACVVVAGPALREDVGSPGVLAVLGLILSVGLAGWGIVLVVRRRASRTLFRLVIAASLVVAVQLALSGTALVA